MYHELFSAQIELVKSFTFDVLELNVVKERICTGRLKKSGICKSGKFCFISQLSKNVQLINLVPPENFVHCSYFEYKTVSDDQIKTKTWLVRQVNQL